jgi:hypothetical protein
MKKLIFLFAMLIVAISASGQSATTKIIPANGTYSVYTPVASDTICGTATKYWNFFADKGFLYFYVSTVRFDPRLVNPTGTGTGRTVGNHVTLTLQGSIDGTSYVNIDTCLVHPTTTVTTLQNNGKVLNWTSDVATGVLWRYLRVSATGGDANKTATLTSLAIKLGKKD